MKNQLETGTYCVFATASECKAAFERAKELGFDFLGEHYNNEFIFVCSDNATLYTYWEESDLIREGKKKIPAAEFLARMEGTWEHPIEQLTLPQAKTYTQDEVIDLLIAERTRAKDIAYEFYQKYKQEFDNYESAGNTLAFVKEEKAEVARYIGNAISGRNGLTSETETIRDRIKQQFNNAKPE